MCVRVQVCWACVLAACFLIVIQADVGVTIAHVRIRKSTNAAWDKANSMHVRLGARVCVCAGCTYVPACLPASLRACIGAQHCQLQRVDFLCEMLLIVTVFVTDTLFVIAIAFVIAVVVVALFVAALD